MKLKTLESVAACACIAFSLLLGSCSSRRAPDHVGPRLPEACNPASRAEITVPNDQGVRISVGRRGFEPSFVSIAVLIDDQFREDGRFYPPGPDSTYYRYPIRNPTFFAPENSKTKPKQIGASMFWSSDGVVYDHPAKFTTICRFINGATINFYTSRTAIPNIIVEFEFYPPRVAEREVTSPTPSSPTGEAKSEKR